MVVRPSYTTEHYSIAGDLISGPPRFFYRVPDSSYTIHLNAIDLIHTSATRSHSPCLSFSASSGVSPPEQKPRAAASQSKLFVSADRARVLYNLLPSATVELIVHYVGPRSAHVKVWWNRQDVLWGS